MLKNSPALKVHIDCPIITTFNGIFCGEKYLLFGNVYNRIERVVFVTVSVPL